VISVDEARKIALELPETAEQDHHGRPSFRVAGRIFATLWGPDLAGAKADLLADLLADAWEGNAPARLVRDRIAKPRDSRG